MTTIQSGKSEKAKWVIRHYREIADRVKRIERKRPRLVSRIDIDEETGVPLPVEKQIMMGVKSDRPVVTEYVEGRTAMDIVDVVLAERLSSTDAAIMTDLCLNGMPVNEVAAKHGISEKTVKRARIRTEAAYADEVYHRNAAQKALSSDDR